jgi:hypothetical protein
VLDLAEDVTAEAHPVDAPTAAAEVAPEQPADDDPEQDPADTIDETPAPAVPPTVRFTPPPVAPPRRLADDGEWRGFLARNGKRVLAAVAALGLLAAVLVGVFGGSGAPQHAGGDPLTAGQKWMAEEFWNQYARDNAAANRMFEEMSIELIGRVRKVVPDGPKPVVVLETPSQAYGVVCEFRSRDDLADLKQGDRVAVVGEGTARRQPNTDVVLANCRLRKGAVVDQ